MKFIIANWKSNKTVSEARKWLSQLSNLIRQSADQLLTDKEIIVCPPFTLLPDMKSSIAELGLSIKLGAQDISPYDEGPYTGAVNGGQIKELADYVIIGHSERRTNFSENDQMLTKKVEMAKKYNLIPIFCIQNQESPIPKGVEIVTYEPVFAIGTDNPDTPENVNRLAQIIKEKSQVSHVLYGGSVTSENVKSFTSLNNIAGVLVGTQSLEAGEFFKIISNA